MGNNCIFYGLLAVVIQIFLLKTLLSYEKLESLLELLKQFIFIYYYQKCVSHVQVDSRELDRRKTLQVTLPVKPPNDNDEFEKQRTAAIAEVAKSKEVRN